MSDVLREALYWSVIACTGYLVLTMALYFVLMLVAAFENARRTRQGRAEDYRTLATSRFGVPVSVVAAAFNEEATIVPAVRSLLALDYPQFEVIVVNDGSADGTLDRLKDGFRLQPRETFYRRVLPTQAVRAVYRSAEDPRLVVVDKANGGKADALNCGINFSRYRYVCGVDADTIFARDALLKGMRLATKDPGSVVGVTSHVAISFRPEEHASHGGIDAHPLSNFQHLDYLRSFLNTRLAWSRLNFMLCVVGAFQIWRRDVLEEVGGFSTDFTCEDIELTFRVHEKFRRERRPYQILSLPDTVATTEGPDRLRRLVSQRARWQRVIMETVWHYRGLTGRRRFGAVGMVGVPFYIVSEVLAPFFELLAVALLPLAWMLGVLDWESFALVVGAIAFGNAILTSTAVLFNDLQARPYGLRHMLRLICLGPLELLVYRPVLMWARLKGTWDFFRGDRSWHKFQRNARRAPAAAA